MVKTVRLVLLVWRVVLVKRALWAFKVLPVRLACGDLLDARVPLEVSARTENGVSVVPLVTKVLLVWTAMLVLE